MKKSIKELFWDYNISEKDFKSPNEEIIVRILNYGDLDDWRWLFKKIGKNKIINIIKKNPNIPIRKSVLKLLSIILNIKDLNNAFRGNRRKK
ncbi:MAG: DUF6922 domain-containing protein [Minisyncoccia bacterium]